MKQAHTVFLATLAIGLLSFHPLAFSAQETDVPPVEVGLQIVTNEELQTRLLNTLENAQGIAAGIGLSRIYEEQVSLARTQILSASSEDLEAIPSEFYKNLALIEVGTGNLRLSYDPSLQVSEKRSKDQQRSGLEQSGQGMNIQSIGPTYDKDPLAEPVYPDSPEIIETFEKGEIDEDSDGGDGKGEIKRSACHNPGTDYTGRAIALNVALIADAVRNVMDQICDQTILANTSVACIPFDIVADVLLAVDANLALCNDHIGAAEVTATWAGLNVVHGNVQHVHDDVADVDSDLSDHNIAVRKDINEHDSDMKTQITAHDTNIDSDLITHDTHIDNDLSAHDANIDGDLIQHDADLKSQLAGHDLTIKAQLATHDADIKARLGELQATVDENQRLIRVSMTRQAEVMRLLLTPEGKREINPAVLSCTGEDCPLIDEIISCSGENNWPCQ